MALPIIRDAYLEIIEEYRLHFSPANVSGYGWSFPCDAAGNVAEAALQPGGLDNLRMCRSGQDRNGITIARDGVIYEPRIIRHPVIARCYCGARVELESSWLNSCVCGRDYDGSGTMLAPRQHWGEETGEHWADLATL